MKGNMFLSQARGRLGSVVFYRQGGQQIARTYAEKVNNPKVLGQRVQRAVFSTVSKAAAMMRPIVDHSFYGVNYGTDSMKEFRRLNLEQVRSLYLNNSQTLNLTARNGKFVPNEYIISKGTLPSFNPDDQDGFNPFFRMEGGEDGGSYEASTLTKAEFFQVYPWLRGGDQLTLVMLNKASAGSLSTGSPDFQMTWIRVVLNPQALIDEFPDSTEFIGSNGFNVNFIDQSASSGNIQLLRGISVGEGVFMGVNSADISSCYALGLILSRFDGSTWNRSTTSLWYLPSDVTNVGDVLDSYGEVPGISSASNEILNAALEIESNVTPYSDPALRVQQFAGGEYVGDGRALIGASDNASLITLDGQPFRLVVSAGSSDEWRLSWASLKQKTSSSGAPVPVGDAIDLDQLATKGNCVLTFEGVGDGNLAGGWEARARWYKDGAFGVEASKDAVINITITNNQPSGD